MSPVSPRRSSALTRPTYQFLGLLLAAVLFVGARLTRRAEPWREALPLAAISVVVVGGMCVFNLVRFDYPGLTPLLGYNLATRTASFVERLPDEEAPLRAVLVQKRDEDLVRPDSCHCALQYIFDIRDDLSRVTGLAEPALSKRLTSVNLRLIAMAPLSYLSEVASAMGSFWMPGAGDLANRDSGALQLLWAAVHLAVLAAFMAQLVLVPGLLLAGVIRRWDSGADGRHWAGPYGLALLVIGYTFVVSTAIDTGSARYRSPTDILIVFVAFVGGRIILDAVAARGSGGSTPP